MEIQRYREADIQSLPPEKLLVLLYEKMMGDLLDARQAIVTGDRIAMADRVNHSQLIIAELRSALDHEVGGEISRNLESLYDFLFVEHLAVLVDQDLKHIDNCLVVLTPLLTAWRQIPAGTSRESVMDPESRSTENQERKNQPSSLFSVSA